MNINTIYVSPKHKLKIIDKYGEKIVNDKYKQNKIDAVFYTNHLLNLYNLYLNLNIYYILPSINYI